MAPRKKSTIRRLQNIKSRQGAQPAAEQGLAPNPESSVDGPVALSGGLTLDMAPTAYTHVQPESRNTPESPDKLAGDLDNLTLEVLLEDDIILEDPPEDEDDPIDDRNPSSLAGPKGDEALALPPPDAKDLLDDENEGSEYIK